MLSPISNRAVIDIARQQRLAQALTETQVQISTGRRIQRASDDPLAAQRIASLAQQQANSATWARNLDFGLSANEDAASTAQALTDHLSEAREAVLVSGGVLSADDHETIALQLEGLATAIDRLATKSGTNGQPLFPAGSANMVRFSATVSLAPVPTREAIFSGGGITYAQMVRDAAAAVRAGTPAATATALTTLEGATSAATESLARIGQIGRELSDLREEMAVSDISVAAERSLLEDTDLSVAIAKLNTQQLTLEAARAVFARINQSSLFDMIR
jgi:flagellar hook-associated protein 3 FlgL